MRSERKTSPAGGGRSLQRQSTGGKRDGAAGKGPAKRTATRVIRRTERAGGPGEVPVSRSSFTAGATGRPSKSGSESKMGSLRTRKATPRTLIKEGTGKTQGRRKTLGEVRAQAYLSSREGQPGKPAMGKGKKTLRLKGEKRPSRQQMLRELGHTTERMPSKHTPEKSELVRLNRFIANSGVCSRREADTFITAGVVKVNGQTVTELGTKISPSDEVRFDDRLITPERKVYLLINKPKDVVTTTDDAHAEHTVMDLIKGACEERIYPVGRLDRNTTGVLLLTNDGDLSKKLTHPSHKVEKVYQVTLDKSVSVNDIQKIASGIELDDGLIAADAVTFVEGQDKDTVGVEIHSGRHRVVRRIFEHLGYRVKSLDRVSFAGLTKKNMPRGKWRFLTPREVSYLKMK
jgi:23S rRNA pseudouridine2605 synthase